MSKRRLEDDSGAGGSGKAARGVHRGDGTTVEAFKAHVEGLNKQFSSWVSRQAGSNLGVLWTEGVKDYLQHAEGLLQQFKDVLDTATEAGKPSVTFGGPGFAFGTQTTSLPSGTVAASATAKPSDTFAFGVATTATNPEQPADKPVSTFGFPAPAANDKQSGGLFSFGAPTTAPPTADKQAASNAEATAAHKPLLFGAAASTEPPASVPAASGTAAPSLGSTTAASVFGGSSSSSAGFTFGSTTAASSSPTFAFGSSAPAFSFAKPAGTDSQAAAPASSVGFSFGTAAPASSAAGSGFSFAPTTVAGTTFTFGGGAVAGGAGGDDDDGADPDAEKPVDEFAANTTGVQVDENVEILFKVKARFQLGERATEGKLAWANKGVGFLTLRKLKNEKPTKPYIVFAMENGRVLFTAYLSKSMKIVANDTSKSVAFTAPYAEAGATPKLTNVMFQMAPKKNHDFKEAAEKLQAELA